jgi:CubicO group peptidase (beta-lactamase class C family)
VKQTINRIVHISLVVSLALLPTHARIAQTELTTDEIKTILRDRIDVANKSVGIVVGLIDDKGTRIISYGKPNQNSSQPLDGNSVFEIGSVTKVFTATLLADMAERGEVSLMHRSAKSVGQQGQAFDRTSKEPNACCDHPHSST